MKKDDFRDLLARRKYYRVLREMKVRYRLPRLGDPHMDGRTVDVSLGGVRLNVRRELPPGEVLEIVIHDEHNDRDVVLTGTVGWAVWNESTRSYDVGIQFPKLSPEQCEQARELVGCQGGDDGGQRRRYVRLKRHLSVELRESLLAKKLLARMLDVSLGGMAVESEKEFKKDAVCSANIFLPGKRDAARVKTRILDLSEREGGERWSMRLRFEAFEGDAREHIGRYLSAELRRPQP